MLDIADAMTDISRSELEVLLDPVALTDNAEVV